VRAGAGLGLLALLAGGCGAAIDDPASYDWIAGRGEHPAASGRAIQLRWRRQIQRDFEGPYIPTEQAGVALDPPRDRIYVGSRTGRLHALTGAGTPVYVYDAAAPIGATPLLEASSDALYVATEGGVVHRLDASTGAVRWRTEVGGAISNPAQLQQDLVYVVTDDDVVVALTRDDGEVLWRVRRDAPEANHVSGHAGITITERHLLAAFTEGNVVSLGPRDGALQWERNFLIDLPASQDGPPSFADVDTTPRVLGDVVYVASAAAGLYALELQSGTVRWREEDLTEIRDIAVVAERYLVLSSGARGIIAFDPARREELWSSPILRGAPGPVTVAGDIILVGESQGGFLSLALANGEELSRIETGFGFTARASVAQGRGFILSNGGALLAFALPGAR
jgi:outer membrane protein assembly factor BamB